MCATGIIRKFPPLLLLHFDFFHENICHNFFQFAESSGILCYRREYWTKFFMFGWKAECVEIDAKHLQKT